MKYRVSILFALLAQLALGIDPKTPPGEDDCLAAILQGLRADIVQILPALQQELGSIRAKMDALSELPDPKEIAGIGTLLKNLQSTVKATRWSPVGLSEKYMTPAHFGVRDAAHDLKNALQVAVWEANRLPEALTRTEREALLRSIGNNLDLTQALFKTIEDPTTSPKRLLAVRELFRDLQALLDGLPAGITLTISQPALGLAVNVSRTDILRLVQNLVLNAVEAMPNGGDIHLSGTAVLVETRPFLEIRVEDTGPGLNPRQVTTLFSGRARRESSERVNHRGVGLVSVNTLADSNRGMMSVKSPLTEQGGTAVSVLLPRIDREMTEQIEKEIAVASEPGQVVIVDDSRSERAVVQRTVQERDLPTATFSTALAAIEFCRRHKDNIRAIVLDQTLEDGSSMESTIESLRAEGVTAPIIACTAADVPRGIPVQGVMYKPFSIETFMKLLGDLAPGPTTP